MENVTNTTGNIRTHLTLKDGMEEKYVETCKLATSFKGDPRN